MPALGGAARRLASDANSPAWKPDGQSVIYVSGTESHRTIMEVPARGGAPRALLGGDQSTWEWNRISCSADGRWISLEDQMAGILLMPSAAESHTLSSPTASATHGTPRVVSTS